MRPQPDLPRQPSRRDRTAERGSPLAGRGRAVLGGVLAALFFLLISLRGTASFYTEYLWFQSLNLDSVFRTALEAKFTLTLIGGLVFFALCWGNLTIAERIAPAFRPSSGDDDLIERYHEIVGRRAGAVRLAMAGFLAVMVGLSLGSSWNEWILFRNRVDFNQVDATFKTDVGFYVFQLPFLTTVTSWLFSALILIFIVTLLAHVANGGIRFNAAMDRVTPQVKAHISVLLGAMALVQGIRYWLDRYQLTFSTRGTVDGVTYTDFNVQLRVIYLLMAISVFAFTLFIANIWRRGWVLPAMGVGLWLFVAVLAGGIVPAFVQRFRVEPSESSMEKPFIEQNIAATRDAYGLGDVATAKFDFKGDLSVADLKANVGTLQNARLWDPATTRNSYEQKQKIKSFYEINDVDVDRYMIDGKMTQVMLAVRDLATEGISQPSWEATHLAYTHGYGVVVATANDKTTAGDPVLVGKDIPVQSSAGFIKVDRPGIYIGENKSSYVIVGTNREEIDYQGADNVTETTSYTGKDGIRLGSGVSGFVRKAAFSLRFGDVNPLVSGNIRADSKVLIERDVTARLKTVAPFLAYDHDPYAVVIGGKIKYVVDGYTTSRNYPNAQRADTGGLDGASGLRGRSFNYARNSVKAVVDAYDGTVKLYVVDDKDPMIKAYAKAFPDLFTPVAKAPKSLADHFRYPEDLFTVQTQMWAKYHVTNADTFYNRTDEWAVPKEPGVVTVKNAQATTVGPDGQALSPSDRYQSQYLLMKLPGDEKESFVLLRPYVAGGKAGTSQNQLISFIAVRSDPGDYGKIQTFVLPANSLPDGPNLAADAMQSDQEVGNLRKDLCQGKNQCDLPAPTLIPIGESIMYVQSFFVAGTDVGAPKLKQVIVSYQSPDGTKVAVAGTFRQALVKLFGNDVPKGIEDTKVIDSSTGPDRPTDPGSGTTTTTTPDGSGTITEQESRLIDQLALAFDAADAALADGDPVGYAQRIQEARGYAERLATLRARGTNGGTGSTTTVPGSTTTTKPSGATTTTTSAGA